ncbi:class II glutamine amidotransferase [Melioribacteraceae bacterium 4301-Me]|uniref:class II glutamine amidotransferase n=1 Tax=Pyranulibacter aquaticus TaxID=3163344 RepID=UPI00359A8795
MCRLLYISSQEKFQVKDYLKKFALISKNSKEYQGHGWGCAIWEDDMWKYYKNLNPIWEDSFEKFGETIRLIAHARSAFRDQGISIENNMPFYDENYVFIFNGELSGVRIKEKGRIGAEKIFNFIKRFDKGNIKEAIAKGTEAIKKLTSYIRAMNIIIADKKNAYVYSHFNENPEYFTMHFLQNENMNIVCSEKLDTNKRWRKINNNSLLEF